MRKRKLRFHVRKNYERNCPPKKLIVSIPLLSLPQNDSCIANDPPTSSTPWLMVTLNCSLNASLNLHQNHLPILGMILLLRHLTWLMMTLNLSLIARRNSHHIHTVLPFVLNLSMTSHLYNSL